MHFSRSVSLPLWYWRGTCDPLIKLFLDTKTTHSNTSVSNLWEIHIDLYENSSSLPFVPVTQPYPFLTPRVEVTHLSTAIKIARWGDFTPQLSLGHMITIPVPVFGLLIVLPTFVLGGNPARFGMLCLVFSACSALRYYLNGQVFDLRRNIFNVSLRLQLTWTRGLHVSRQCIYAFKSPIEDGRSWPHTT